MSSVLSGDGYDRRLAQAVLDGAPDAERAALTLFERREPRSRTQAIDLVVPFGPVPPETFDCIARAYDVYRHTVDMPHD
jgi:hypothetical protein